MHEVLFLSLTRMMYLVKEIVQVKDTFKSVAYLEAKTVAILAMILENYRVGGCYLNYGNH